MANRVVRIGKVTNIDSSAGKVRVVYEDSKNASLPLSVITINGEYYMPSIGDMVVTLQLDNSSSKGFIIGPYYGENKKPNASSGYRKDLGEGVFITCENGEYYLCADNIKLKCSYGETTLEALMKQSGGSANVEAISQEWLNANLV